MKSSSGVMSSDVPLEAMKKTSTTNSKMSSMMAMSYYAEVVATVNENIPH